MKIFCLVLVGLFSIQTFAYDQKYIEMSPPKAKKYQKAQLARMDEMRTYKKAGYIGESDDGNIAIHEISKAKPEEQKKIKKFVEDENKDRAAVVKEVVAFNKMNERHKGILIKSIFEVYKNSSIKGSFYYQNKTWQKHF